VSYFLPTAGNPSAECIAFASTHPPSSIAFNLFETLIEVGSEELVFRAGIQNLLKRLERSSSPIFAFLGSLKNRTLISSTLFSINHLSYHYWFANPCSSMQARITQVIRNLSDANYTALYENFGIAASFSSHLLNTGLMLIPKLIQRALLDLLIQKPKPIRPDLLQKLMRS